jgi:peptidoglycan hydrolase CwlO-like protein
MTPSNDSNDFIREINRRFRDLTWRVERLESTQMPARSLDEAFDQVYNEIDALEDKVDALRDEMRERFNALDAKFEIVMNYITGKGTGSN